MKKESPNYPIKVLDKSLTLIELLLKHESSMNITEISKSLGFYPSTTHRILDTFKHWGYIEQDTHTQKYQLGLKALELGMAKLNRIDIVNEATPFLKELVRGFNETVHLGALQEGEVVYLAKEESSQTIRMISNVGRRAPLHCTALGKVLLAHLPQKEQKKYFAEQELYRLTENTIVDKEKLNKELELVRKNGYALDKEENEKDVCCVGVPIKNYQGMVVAAISVSSPCFRLNRKKLEDLKIALIEISSKISKRLGYRN